MSHFPSHLPSRTTEQNARPPREWDAITCDAQGPGEGHAAHAHSSVPCVIATPLGAFGQLHSAAVQRPKSLRKLSLLQKQQTKNLEF